MKNAADWRACWVRSTSKDARRLCSTATSLPNAANVPNSRRFVMPIYEYYCPDNHTIYQFYAKTLAQGQTTPKCPDNPNYRLKKLVSAFAITSSGASDEAAE